MWGEDDFAAEPVRRKQCNLLYIVRFTVLSMCKKLVS
jgi:hypothetical protein